MTPTTCGNSPSRPAAGPVVLHIEDDPNDGELLNAAVAKARVSCRLQHVEDREQAMAYLTGSDPFADRERYPAPSLILLDLKLPRTTGFEILAWLRNQPALAGLPVIVLSGSGLPEDKERAVRAGANAYFVKPLAFQSLVALAAQIGHQWLACGAS